MSTPPTASQLQRARALARQDPQAAVQILQQIVAAAPDHAGARHELAMLLLELGKPADALGHLQRAVALLPESLPLLNNLGALLEQLNRTEEAIACYQRAATLAPAEAVPHANLGLALRMAGRLADATAALRVAATLDPRMAEAWAALGSCLVEGGSPKGALGPLRHAVALAADHPRAWHVLGDALQSLGQHAEAIPCYERASQLRPADPEVWYGLGRAHAGGGAPLAATGAFSQCVALAPRHAAALHEQGKALFELGCVEQAVMLLRRAAATGNAEARRVALENLAVIVPGSPADDNQSILTTREAYARSLPAEPAAARPARRSATGPLRVGYFSSFFHRAWWMKPVWALIDHHDRSRVEVHLFVDGHADAVRTSIEQRPEDRLHDVGGATNEAAARRIAAENLDVLVDLNGYSVPRRLPVYLQRPARVQVGWFNYYATSGLSCFDALVGDPHVIPLDEEPFYTERIVRLPHSYLTFDVRHPAPDVTTPPILVQGHLTFGSLASQYKLTDAVVRTWATILMRCPGARLLLRNASLGRPDHRQHLTARFAACGIGQDRLVLDGPAPHLEFLATYGRIDVALDPFPYSGGTTTMEALWQGVPVVTFDGGRWASRTSVSLLRAAGLGEYVARDVEDQVEMCVRLAQAPDTGARLRAFRASARDRLRAAPVCDAMGLARAMEALFEQLAPR